MNKILFSTEFSDHAKHVFRYATELASALDAPLALVHGFGKPDVRAQGEDKQAKARHVINRLEKFARENKSDELDLDIELIAEYGYPADAVLEAARKHGASLIVVGMTGSSKPSERQIGSTTREIMRRVEKRAVLAVPSTARFEGLKQIAFTTNFEFRDLKALRMLHDAAQVFGSQITVLHVLEPGDDRQEAEANLDTLRGLFASMEHIDFLMLEGEVKAKVEAYIADNDVDLLAMVSHRRGFMHRILEGSVSRDMVGEIGVPLLVFRD